MSNRESRTRQTPGAPVADSEAARAAPADPATPATTAAPARARRPFTTRLDVRWRDLDAFNHVNNSSYLTYLEEARLQWLRHVPGPWLSEQSMPVLAASELNYRMPIEWPGQLAVELYCKRLGNTSLAMSHRIVDANDEHRLYSDGHVVMVWINPTTGKPMPLPQAVRDAAEALESTAG